MTDANVATQAARPDQPERAQGLRPWHRPGPLVILLGLTLLAANACTIAGLAFPFLVPAVGLLLLVGIPVWLLMVKVDWRASAVVERLGFSLATTLLLLMIGGLLLNTLLPPLGIKNALGPVPVLLLEDGLVAGLVIWRRERLSLSIRSFRLTIYEKTVTRLSAASVVLAVIGASRLNNGTGDSVAMAALALAALTLGLVFRWQDRLRPGVICFVIYALGLALLLMTSLRGWYTTGHDIQREYRVFELTKTNGNWNIARFRDPYDACLSITILPTMLWDMTKIHDPYVYKVLYQVMFALCPVLVYRLSLRFTTPAISLIAITYLMCFPTFSNDMPFLNRQEIAFLFLAAILLMLTSEAMPIRQKRLWIMAFSLGLIVSHYSSAAVFIATMLAAGVMHLALRLGRGLRAARPARSLRAGRPGRRRLLPGIHPGAAPARPVFGLLSTAVVSLGAVLWIGVITQTGGTITSTLHSAVSGIGQTFSFSAKSSDVAYNVFSFSQPSSTQLLNEYRQQTIAQTGHRGSYYPLSDLAARAPTQAVDITAPPSALGRDLGRLGINVTTLNAVLRGGAAKLLQLLVVIGLIAALLSRDVRFRIRREPYLFAVATFLVLVAQVVVPVVSENYGILRAFMQGLLILAPVLAYGSVVAFMKLGGRWAIRVATGLALFLFVCLSGLLPQLLGGYEQQLSLDNSGLYYDIFYPHTEEVAAVNWLRRHIRPSLATSVQSEVITDEFEFQRLKFFSGVNAMNDIYPTLLRRNSYLFLGSTTVHQDLAPLSYRGNLIIYRYPMGFLRREKDLIFNNGSAEVYR